MSASTFSPASPSKHSYQLASSNGRSRHRGLEADEDTDQQKVPDQAAFELDKRQMEQRIAQLEQQNLHSQRVIAEDARKSAKQQTQIDQLRHKLQEKDDIEATLPAGPSPSRSDSSNGDWKTLRSEMHTELKRHMAALHAGMEDKLRIAERRLAATIHEHSKTIAAQLQQAEEKTRAADEILRQVQVLHQAMQMQSHQLAAMTAAAAAPLPNGFAHFAPAGPPSSAAPSSATFASSPPPSSSLSSSRRPAPAGAAPAAPVSRSAVAAPAAPAASTSAIAFGTTIYPSPTRRPASPTIRSRTMSVPAPPRRDPSPPPPRIPAPTTFPHPPPFANTLPFYHDPRDPLQPFLMHSSHSHGAYVPPAPSIGDARPNPVHTYPRGTRSASPPTTSSSRAAAPTGVRAAADATLALSPLRSRSSSPSSSPRAYGANSGIHHHLSNDDMIVAPRSKPYALIPSHFPPAASPSSYFDRENSGNSGEGTGNGSRRGSSRHADEDDLLTDKALTTGMGNIDQLLASMEYVEEVERSNRSRSRSGSRSRSRSRGRNSKKLAVQGPPPVVMKRTGGGFVATNLLQKSLSQSMLPAGNSSARSKSPYKEDTDDTPFLSSHSRRAAALANGAPLRI